VGNPNPLAPRRASTPRDGWPAERLTWLRQTRAADPSRAAAAITTHWQNEEPAFRESIVRLVADHPHPSDQDRLQTHTLTDRRQDIRESAARALITLPESPCRLRALDRARRVIRLQRHLLKRASHPDPAALKLLIPFTKQYHPWDLAAIAAEGRNPDAFGVFASRWKSTPS